MNLKKIDKALTHAGKFHADDVFSSAFLKIVNPNIKILRANEVPKDFEGLVFDIGNGQFDHHGSDNESRENGIPYAAFGKLWKEFAKNIYGEYVYKNIDKKLIEDLDLSDNTGSYNALANAISVFNPLDKKVNSDKEFFQAVGFAKIILKNMIEKEKLHEKERKIVEEIYNKSSNKKVLVLDKHYYFQDILPFKETIYVIYPSNRGGYCAQGVPINPYTVDLKKYFPSSWVVNLPKYLKFCHKSRFLITANELEDIKKACNEALK